MKTKFPYAFAGALTAAMMALGAASADASDTDRTASCAGVLMVIEQITAVYPPDTEAKADYVLAVKSARSAWHSLARSISTPERILSAIRLTWEVGQTEEGQAAIKEIVNDCLKNAPRQYAH